MATAPEVFPDPNPSYYHATQGVVDDMNELLGGE